MGWQVVGSLFGLQAGGDILKGDAQKRALDYQFQVSRNNAGIAQTDAEYSAAAGHQRAAQIGERNANTSGRIKAAQGANGVDVNSGSAVDVQAGQRQAGQLDALTEEHNALLQAFGYQSQAMNYNAQAAVEKNEADQAPLGAGLAAAGDLISQSSSLATKWLPYVGG